MAITTVKVLRALESFIKDESNLWVVLEIQTKGLKTVLHALLRALKDVMVADEELVHCIEELLQAINGKEDFILGKVIGTRV